MENKKIKLGIINNQHEEFYLSDIFNDSYFTDSTIKAISGKNIEFYLISEIKGTLDIEGEGSSRKIIKDLISGKRKPNSNSEQKAINLYSVMNFIKQTKPTINKTNLMIIYNMLKLDIDMKGNELENKMDYRQSIGQGFVGKFKTPDVKIMNKGMDDLFKFINSDLMNEAVLEKSLLIQMIFIYFHPFYDFNGRTGRLLTFWYLVNCGQESLSNTIYMALPQNKKKYVKMFEAMRKFSWSDLTTFLNFLKSLVAYGVNKMNALENVKKKKGISINSSEELILFYLIDAEGWTLVNNIELKIDLGISKQGIHNAIASLVKKDIVITKKESNKLFVMSKLQMNSKLEHPLKFFYKVWSKDMSVSNLTIEKAKKLLLQSL